LCIISKKSGPNPDFYTIKNFKNLDVVGLEILRQQLSYRVPEQSSIREIKEVSRGIPSLEFGRTIRLILEQGL